MELRKQKLKVEEQKEIKIFYGDNFLFTPLTEKRFSVVSRHIYTFLYHKEIGLHRIDLAVEGQIIVELKAVLKIKRAVN